MAIIKIKELRALESEGLQKKLSELRLELNVELGSVAAGGRASNPGRIKELRRTIARILTLEKERVTRIAAKAA